jgi:hypothetical protein
VHRLTRWDSGRTGTASRPHWPSSARPSPLPSRAWLVCWLVLPEPLPPPRRACRGPLPGSLLSAMTLRYREAREEAVGNMAKAFDGTLNDKATAMHFQRVVGSMVASSFGVGDPEGEVQRSPRPHAESANQHRRGAAVRRPRLRQQGPARCSPPRPKGGTGPLPCSPPSKPRSVPAKRATRRWMAYVVHRHPGRSIGRPPRPSWTPAGREGPGGYLQVPALSSRHQANGLRAFMRGRL